MDQKIIDNVEYTIDGEENQEKEALEQKESGIRKFLNNPWTKRIGKAIGAAGILALGIMIGSRSIGGSEDESSMITDGSDIDI